jgi:hypothetical protein
MSVVRGRQSEAGYSLVELLVSSAVMLTVTGAIFGMMSPSQGATQVQTEVADLQQRMRIGSDVLFKELMMAGAGVYQGPATGSLINFFAPIVPRRMGVEPLTTFRADAFTLTYIPNSYAQTTISKSMPPQSSELKVTDMPNCPKGEELCGFTVGMTVLIFDSSGHFDTFDITNVQDSAAHLQHRGQDLSYSYEAGTTVTQSVSNTYYHNALTRQLIRSNGTGESPLVDNLVEMQVSYFGDPNPPRLPKPPLGESNCLYDASGNYLNLPVLTATDGSLALLPAALLTNGPFCGGGDNRYDADLLRVRKVRVSLRMQVGSDMLRGLSTTLWKNPGKANDGGRIVPDYAVTFEVSPRNLNLAR